MYVFNPSSSASIWTALKVDLNQARSQHGHACICMYYQSQPLSSNMIASKGLQMNLLYPSVCNIPQYSIQNQQTHLHLGEPAESQRSTEDPGPQTDSGHELKETKLKETYKVFQF